jgi:membrane protein
MLWFYISGLVILIGAEMNAVIEHASPYGKEPGEKVPGQRRKIGPAAMRAWVGRRRQHGGKPPSAEEVKDVVGPAPPSTVPGAPVHEPDRTPLALPAPAPTGFSSWVIGAGVVAAQIWLAVKALRNRKIGA